MSSTTHPAITEFAALAAYVAAILILAAGAIALCAPIASHLVH